MHPGDCESPYNCRCSLIITSKDTPTTPRYWNGTNNIPI